MITNHRVSVPVIALSVSMGVLGASGCGTDSNVSPAASEIEQTGLAQNALTSEASAAAERETLPESFPGAPAGSDKAFTEYRVKTRRSQALVKGATISRRKEKQAFTKSTLPRIVFSSHPDKKVVERLVAAADKILAMEPDYSRVVGEGDLFIYRSDSDIGGAWAVKGTGAFAAKRNDSEEGVSVIKDAEDAVNRALDQIVDSDLLSLANGETLEVLGVTRTWEAAWQDRNGEMVLVSQETPGGEVVTQFVSEYTVYFGRSYKDVPILGPVTGARLDSSGRMVAFWKHWRDIDGEEGSPMELLGDEEIGAKKNRILAENLELRVSICGYVEDETSHRSQRSPGPGCQFVYDNPEYKDTMNAEIEEWVGISRDSSIAIPRE